MQYGVGFGPPVYLRLATHHGRQAERHRRSRRLARQLICALDMSPPERTLRDEMTARHIPYALQAHSEQGELDAAIAVGKCAGTGMETRLAQSRANFHARTSDFVFLPERFGIDPVVPAYLRADQNFGLDRRLDHRRTDPGRGAGHHAEERGASGRAATTWPPNNCSATISPPRRRSALPTIGRRK